jgi:hypothetical protein
VPGDGKGCLSEAAILEMRDYIAEAEYLLAKEE